jgi:hypothetical protein
MYREESACEYFEANTNRVPIAAKIKRTCEKDLSYPDCCKAKIPVQYPLTFFRRNLCLNSLNFASI